MSEEKTTIDLTPFPGLLEKLGERTEVIDKLVSIVNELAEYIKNGFGMQPGEVKTFTFGKRSIGGSIGRKSSCWERVDFKLLRNGFAFSFGTEYDSGTFRQRKLKSKVLARNPYSSDDLDNFSYVLPGLVSAVQKGLEVKIYTVKSIKEILGDCSVERKKS